MPSRFPYQGAAKGNAGRPAQPLVNPETAEVLDTARGGGGAVQVLHVLHGSLQIPNVGRQIVGWVGVFMLISCLTGIWLWWPVTGSVTRGFRWKRQPSFNANLHHQMGFWVLIPLAMLSATGVWISFPQTFSGFEANAPNAGAPKQAGPPRPAQPCTRRMRGPRPQLHTRSRPP